MIETMTWAGLSSMRALRCCGSGAVMTDLLYCESTSAQTASGPALAPAKPVTTFRTSPSLLDRFPVNILPGTVQLPTKAETLKTVHQSAWAALDGNDGTATGFGPVAPTGITRWAEYWQVRDPAKCDDIFDPLKFIPLNGSKSIYLTLSLDEPLRSGFENRSFLGKQKPDGSERKTVRGLYGADLHLGQHLRLYAELVNGEAAGWNGYGYSYSVTYRKRHDLQQGFVEAKAKLLGAKAGVMLGRQSFLDAPDHILGSRETPNVPLSWNGVAAYPIWPRVRGDVFKFIQTNTVQNKMFHDNQNWNVRLFGGYSSLTLAKFATSAVDGTRAGSAIRHNFGTRLWDKVDPLKVSLGGLHQGGEFRPARSGLNRDVDAFVVSNFADLRAAHLPGRPLLGVQRDGYSGGDYNSKDGAIGTYIAPYNPKAGDIDITTYITGSNLVSVALLPKVAAVSALVLRFKVPVMWRESTDDAVYGASRVYGFRRSFSGGYIGTVSQWSAALRITRHLTWTNDVARFLAFSQLPKAGASDGPTIPRRSTSASGPPAGPETS